LIFYFDRFPEDSGVFSALSKGQTTGNPRVSCCSVIIQGKQISFSLFHHQINFFFSISARDEEPLDPCFGQFPQSISLEEGGKAKFSCKLSGSTPMTGKFN